jgi:hypothetical protein
MCEAASGAPASGVFGGEHVEKADHGTMPVVSGPFAIASGAQ